MNPPRRTPFCLAAGLLTLTLLTSPAGYAQTTFRWVDQATGQTVYSDKPPPAGIKYSTHGKALSGSEEPEDSDGSKPSATPSPSYAVRQAAVKYPVEFYSTPDCGDPCQQARAILNGRGIPFAEHSITTQEAFTQFEQRFGKNARFPAVRVGQERFVGFEPGGWNDLLDLAGYPKTAPYGSVPQGKASQ